MYTASKKYTLPRGYLSASAIKTLQTCPRQFEFRYIENKVIPPNAALAIGSVTHKVLETYYQDAMTSRTRLTPEQTGELSLSTLDDWLEDNETTVGSEDRNNAQKMLPDLISRYVENVGQHVQPLEVEKEVRFTTQSGVPLLGYIDLVHQPEDQDEVGIADYKVTSKKMSHGDLANSLQFNLYALMTGVGDIQIHNLVKSAGKPSSRKPADVDGVTDYASNLRVIKHRFDGSQVDHFENLVESAARLITSGIFMPCDPTSWACTPAWCGYWGLCRGSRSTVTKS